jgi:hypothetical protein
MEGDLKDKVKRIARAAFFGFIGGTAIIHITPLIKPIFRDFEDGYLSKRRYESEIAALLIVCFLTLVMEPVTYIVNMAVSLEKYGYIGLLWISPVVISQSYALIRRFMR